MKIVEKYSHLNGLEYLLVHKKSLWREIEKVVANIDGPACRTKVSNEKRMKGELKYSPKAMNERFSEELTQLGWSESRVNYWVTHDQRVIRQTMAENPNVQKQQIISAGLTPILSYNQTDFVKERVALEVQFGKYSFVA